MKHFPIYLILAAWAAVVQPVQAEGKLGRLFYTPEQRMRMDVARQNERSVKVDEDENAPQSTNIELNGMVRRSDGKSTVWVNNRVHGGNTAEHGIEMDKRGGDAGQASVILPSTQQRVLLKVGQSFDVSSGQVEERYRRRPAASPANGVSHSASPEQVKRTSMLDRQPARREADAALNEVSASGAPGQ